MNPREDLMYYGKVATNPSAFYVAGQIEVTTRCFANCSFCAKASKLKRWPKPMGLERALEICTELFSNSWFENLSLTGGDPLAWPHLKELCYLLGQQFSEKKLHLNTTLQRPVPIAEVKEWAKVVKSVRVSIDGVSKRIIKATRGVAYDIDDVFSRMRTLRGAGIETQVNVCVSEANIDHVEKLLEALDDEVPYIRKAMFLPHLGCERKLLRQWDMLVRRLERKEYCFETSFAENPSLLREAVQRGEFFNTRCWASRLSFHMKPDGKVYQCCLTGGEAVDADDDYIVGAFVKPGDMHRIYNSTEPLYQYRTPRCYDICQFKQAALNVIGERASRVSLKLP